MCITIYILRKAGKDMIKMSKFYRYWMKFYSEISKGIDNIYSEWEPLKFMNL